MKAKHFQSDRDASLRNKSTWKYCTLCRMCRRNNIRFNDDNNVTCVFSRFKQFYKTLSLEISRRKRY